MTGPQLAYRSTTPKLVEEWTQIKSERDEAHRRRVVYLEEINNTLPNRDVRGTVIPGPSDRHLHIFDRFDGASGVTGIDILSGEYSNPPLGWRYEKGKGRLQPAKRTPEGKAIVQEWLDRKLHIPAYIKRLKPFGVPQVLHTPTDERTGQGYMYSPGVQLIDGAVYLTWGTVDVAAQFEALAASSEAEWVELSRKEMVETFKKESK